MSDENKEHKCAICGDELRSNELLIKHVKVHVKDVEKFMIGKPLKNTKDYSA